MKKAQQSREDRQKNNLNNEVSDGYGRFTAINEAFICAYCGSEVPPLKKSYRNHCPHCLRSLHVDILPGDRANPCKGILHPIGYDYHHRDGFDLQFKCERCGFVGNNKAATQDPILADEVEAILKLTATPTRLR